MNNVPTLFYEEVCIGLRKQTPICAYRKLSGRFGKVAIETFKNARFQRLEIRNGRFRDEEYFSHFEAPNGVRSRFKKVARKHHWYSSVGINAESGEYSTDPAALEDLSAATKGKRVYLCLETANVSEELEKWVDSIKLCFALHIAPDVTKVPESLIQKKTLTVVRCMRDNDQIMDQVLQLLQQDQFNIAFLSDISQTNLKKLVAEWRENSSAMAGKAIVCAQQMAPDLFLGFSKCTEDDERYLSVYYPRFHCLWNKSAIFIMRNTKAARLYCVPLSHPVLPHRKLLVFA